MWNFYDLSLTIARKDESSIIFRLEVFERDGGFVPSIDVVGADTKIHLYLLQRMETHVVRGLVDSGPES